MGKTPSRQKPADGKLRQSAAVQSGDVKPPGPRPALEVHPEVIERALADSIAGIAVADAKRELVYANQSLARMWGYDDPADMVGKHVSECWQGANVPATPDALVEEGGRIGTAQGKRKDGTLFEVQFATTLIRDDRGRPAYMFGSFVDASAEADLKRRLTESEEKYRTLIENVPCMVYRGRPDWSTEIVSGYSERITGYTATDFDKGVVNWVDLIHPEDRAWVLEEAGETSGPEMRLDQEYRIIKRDGSVVWVKDVKTVYFKNGVSVGAQGVVIDITERKAIQERLTQSDRLASLGLLVAGVAHEMNNPLSVLLGYVNLLKEKLETPALEGFSGLPGVERALSSIGRAAQRCRKVVDDLRAFAQPAEDLMRQVDLQDLLRRATENVRRKATRQGVRILIEVRDGISLRCNPDLLNILLVNVLNNAVQAMEKGGDVTITGRTVDESNCEILIKDAGRGISKEVLNRVFDPFFTTKPFGQGTGLGLSIAYGIAVSHGGRINIDSTPGAGTTVRVCLPVYAGAGKER